jgi:Arc/MetJ-type ribon-helix-helix transcriptional regulator
MSILLNPELEHRIAAKVQSGRYRSPADVIEDGLDLLEARDAVAQTPTEQNEPPIWETIVRLGQKASAEEWSQAPADLAGNLDHYLYKSSNLSE